MLPRSTERLRFREMGDGDLDAMAAMLGDPELMAYYPAPKSRAEAQAWIDRQRERYAAHGHGLWIVEAHDGAFVGDCGLTFQPVGAQGERTVLEVGWHTARALQGRGYATEAGRACVDLARDVLGADRVSSIIHVDNRASRRVAEKLGMTVEERFSTPGGVPAVVYGMRLGGSPGSRRSEDHPED